MRVVLASGYVAATKRAPPHKWLLAKGKWGGVEGGCPLLIRGMFGYDVGFDVGLWRRLQREEMVVERFVLRDDAVDVEVFCMGEGVCLEAFEGGFVAQDLEGVFAHSLDVAD